MSSEQSVAVHDAAVRPEVMERNASGQCYGGLAGKAAHVAGRPSALLILIAVAHAASPLLLLGAHWPFGIDETVYLSQINAFVPAGGFSAPRARGVTLLAAPITLVTNSLMAVRVWVALLSGVALYVGFRPWLRLRNGYVAPIAALMFSSLWITIFYGFAVMPNQWVAMTVLACTGYSARFVQDGRWRHFGAALAGIALVALFRPSDAMYVGIGLAVALAIIPGPVRRRVLTVVGLAVGAALGALQWIIEAELVFGGVSQRLTAAEGQNAASGLHFTGGLHAALLSGKLVCAPGCHIESQWVNQLWWIGLGVLVIVGLVAAQRAKRLRQELVPSVVAAALAAEYLFSLQLAAPRFLLPTYALLFVTAAAGVAETLRAPVGRHAKRVIVATLVVLFLAHSVVQVRVLTQNVIPSSQRASARIDRAARQLEAVGVRPPCIVLGRSAYNQRLTYAIGCTNMPTRPPALTAAMAGGTRVVWLSSKRPPASYGDAWWPIKVMEPTSGKSSRAFVNFQP